jgi:Uma2 family endonuclease
MVQQTDRPDLSVLGPEHNFMHVTFSEFERADAVEGYRFELVDGVLHVSPAPDPPEKHLAVAVYELLKAYCERTTPPAFAKIVWEPRILISTEEESATNPEPDLAAYTEYPQQTPRTYQALFPALVVEIVGKWGRQKDYVRNPELYARVRQIREYWIFDLSKRPDRPTLAVFDRPTGDRPFERRDVRAGGTTVSVNWPGLVVDLSKLGPL